MRRIALVICIILVFTVLSVTRARGDASAAASDVPPNPNIVLLDSLGHPTAVPSVASDVDSFNHTISIRVDPTAEAVLLLLNDSWLKSIVPDPSFANVSYDITNYSGASWFGVPVHASNYLFETEISQFQPEISKPVFSEGSPESILLERPMNISLVEVPNVEFHSVTMSNANGTWVEERPLAQDRLGISFTDADTSGQTVSINQSWLAGFGIGAAWFSYGDGTPISNTTDGFAYYLSPPHFSILYAFTVSDSFVKESDQAYSNVFWDSNHRNIYVLSDRRSPAGTNERMSSPAPVTYDQTTSFTIRGTWKTSQQGNWQLAAPLFFMSAANTKVDMANSIYVLYASRDSYLGNQPLYYLRYRDSTGTLRIDFNVAVNANVQVEFLFSYDAPSRFMILFIYDINGNALGALGYTLGASETFTLGKIGAGAWGSSATLEPAINGTTDNLFMDANRARNGNFEADSNSDGVPDYWQNWIWTKGNVYRSSDRAKYGSWSIKIADTSSTLDYGLQTNYLPASAGQNFVGSSWIYVASGTNAICIEAWSSSSTRLAVSCKNTVTHNYWEYLDVSLPAPSGTATVDMLLYSSSANVGTGYFDSSELRLRRAFWSVTVHNGEAAVPSGLAGWQVAIDKAADLGVSYIRTDFPWNSFQTAGNGIWNQDTINYWQSVRNMAKTRGIDLIAILQGPEPSGVDSSNEYQSFEDFCSGIAVRFGGGSVPYFQLLNEANVATMQTLPGNQNSLISFCGTGLVVGSGSFDFTHKSQYKTIVNVFVTLLWDSNLNSALSIEGNVIDVVAIDYYPSTPGYNINACDDWSPMDTLNQIMTNYGKEGAVMETGYDTQFFGSGQETYVAQDQYVSCALPALYSKVNSWNTGHPSIPVILANWYELYDHQSSIPYHGTGAIDNFGLVLSNLQEKQACTNFRNRVPGFGF